MITKEFGSTRSCFDDQNIKVVYGKFVFFLTLSQDLAVLDFIDGRVLHKGRDESGKHESWLS